MKKLTDICFDVLVSPFEDNESFLISIKSLKGKDSESNKTYLCSFDDLFDLLKTSLKNS